MKKRFLPLLLLLLLCLPGMGGAEGLPTVRLDGHRFRQILFNLVGNAVKFTSAGKVSVAASCSGTGIEFTVSDTGCGIPPGIISLLKYRSPPVPV